MVIDKKSLLEELSNSVRQHLEFGKSLNMKDPRLIYKTDSNTWNALECLEHLNYYGDFYIPEIRKKMDSKGDSNSTVFYTGWLGNKFAQGMLPKDGIKKIKTFKSKNPTYRGMDRWQVIPTFIKQQEQMLNLLGIAGNKDLSKIKTAITLPLLKLRLGDTFRFVIYHNERHITQGKNMISQSPGC